MSKAAHYSGFYLGFFGGGEDDHVFLQSAECGGVLAYILRGTGKGSSEGDGFSHPR